MISERKFEALVASIYEAGADFNRWPDALSLMARAYNAPAVVFGATSPQVEKMWIIAPQVDPVYIQRYASHFHRVNPVWQLMLPAPAGTVRTDSMIMPKHELARTEFYNDFLVPQDHGSMLGAVVHADHECQLSFVVQRKREFASEDVRFHRRLAPHLQRAAQFNLKLAQLEMKCAASAEALDRLDQGTWLVDAVGRVLFANSAAEQLTARDKSLTLVAGRLCARAAADTAKLHALVATCGGVSQDAGAGGSFSLSRGSDRSAIDILVVPSRGEAASFLLTPPPAAIIIATDPDRRPMPPIAWIRQRFGLTKTEAAFAIEILKGDGIQACADRLGMSLGTARTHLSHVFQKTGSRRQAELVRMLLQT